MVLALLCVAQVVVVLDVTIVAIALPAIQADLGLSPAVLGWVLTAYPVAFGGFLLAAGRLADRVGRRRMFAVGLAAFGAASLVCGPKFIVPRHSRLTCKPVRPRWVYSITVLLFVECAFTQIWSHAWCGCGTAPRSYPVAPRYPVECAA